MIEISVGKIEGGSSQIFLAFAADWGVLKLDSAGRCSGVAAVRRWERRRLIALGVADCGVCGAMWWSSEIGCFALGVPLDGDLNFLIC